MPHRPHVRDQAVPAQHGSVELVHGVRVVHARHSVRSVVDKHRRVGRDGLLHGDCRCDGAHHDICRDHKSRLFVPGTVSGRWHVHRRVLVLHLVDRQPRHQQHQSLGRVRNHAGRRARHCRLHLLRHFANRVEILARRLHRGNRHALYRLHHAVPVPSLPCRPRSELASVKASEHAFRIDFACDRGSWSFCYNSIISVLVSRVILPLLSAVFVIQSRSH
mmetsp:Transcript_6985/g.14893  ORF Transcript_6985/g.14893 Transcript_6985/m.14893 type:complete len:219 (+) Transcript_6985:668-1324(+)